MRPAAARCRWETVASSSSRGPGSSPSCPYFPSSTRGAVHASKSTPRISPRSVAWKARSKSSVARGSGSRQSGTRPRGQTRATKKPAPLRAELRSYQQEGLDWLCHLRDHGVGGLLADDMGLGKTIQTIALLSLEKEARRMDQPSLIVVPTSLVEVWRRELKTFAPHLRVLVLHGRERRRAFARLHGTEIAITTYALLHRDLARFKKQGYHYLILDEAQAIKNPRSQASRAARSLRARHRLALTGTPVENNLDELWSLFDFAMPGLLGQHRTIQVGLSPSHRAGWGRNSTCGAALSSLAAGAAPNERERRQGASRKDRARSLRRARGRAAGSLRNDSRRGSYRGAFCDSTAGFWSVERHDPGCAHEASSGVLQPEARARTVGASRRAICEGRRFLFAARPGDLGSGRKVLVFSQFARMLALLSAGLGRRRSAMASWTDRPAIDSDW